ncbi:MAG: queuosine precursor transporter [Phycisphaeraceae bacterium]|nr:queuosine precursor transporter [Phycisphaeraceae bacterium]MCW5753998.1 queuosine precursor transporter [Phycisphaeraceae bacterium]
MATIQTQTSPNLEINPHAFSRQQLVYVWLAGVYITSLLLANIVGVKMFAFQTTWWPLEDGLLMHTMGMLPFPITFLLTDLLNEYYGKKAARRVAYIAFSMAALAWVLIWVSRALPTHEGIPGTATKDAFEIIFGGASLMYLASIVAFLCGTLIDIVLFGVFKRLTRGRFVWLRATGSTVISQLFDSLIISLLFFYVFQLLEGNNPNLRDAINIAFTGYVLKFLIAVAMTPGIYLGRYILQRSFGLKPIRLPGMTV